MDIIFSASIIAAFLAGMVALFAPCCVTVLLPTYLASIFRERKNILKMTFIYFIGISVILVPIGLGAASLAKLFENFHYQLYIAGGLFMLVLAVLSFLGKGLVLIPMPKRILPKTKQGSSKAVFLLGIFSGAATSCCAPVLAGALTLAVLSGAFWKALVVIFSYIFGMTFPLFAAAYLYDRFKLENSRIIKGKIFEIKFGKRTLFLHSTNLVSAVIFLLMGAILLTLALSGNTFWAPSLQVGLGNSLNKVSQKLLAVLVNIPDIVWGIIIIGIFFLMLYNTAKRNSKEKYGKPNSK